MFLKFQTTRKGSSKWAKVFVELLPKVRPNGSVAECSWISADSAFYLNYPTGTKLNLLTTSENTQVPHSGSSCMLLSVRVSTLNSCSTDPTSEG